MKNRIRRMEEGGVALPETSVELQAGRIELRPEEVDVEKFIRAAFESHRFIAEERKISIAAHIGASVSAIQADPRRLDRVLNNLLNNALESTPPGGDVEIGAAASTGSEMKFWVRDTGVGIAPEEVRTFFEKHKQSPSGKTSKHRGPGLRLAICKMIVEAHGGKLSMVSSVGKGTTFTFTMPLVDAAKPQAAFDLEVDPRRSSEDNCACPAA